MRNLTATICLTLAVLLGSAGVSWSAYPKSKIEDDRSIWLANKKGLTAYDSKDYTTALREWNPLAEQGNASAQFMLGIMYNKRRGVPKNDKTSMKWYRLAAEQGQTGAKKRLAKLSGEGPIEDLVLQYKQHIQIKEVCVANGIISKRKLDSLTKNYSKIKVMLLRKHKVPKHKHKIVNQSSYNAALKWFDLIYKLPKKLGLVGGNRGNIVLSHQQKSKLKLQCRKLWHTAFMLQHPYLFKDGNKKGKKK